MCPSLVRDRMGLTRICGMVTVTVILVVVFLIGLSLAWLSQQRVL